MHIISASRRTDIPAFYTRWFLQRLRAGFCHVVNPFNRQVSRVALRPEDCLALVWWTRNPRPLLPHLPTLLRDGYRGYVHMTITGYPRLMEPYAPPLEEAITNFRQLAEILAPAPLCWRYDPLLLGNQTPIADHLAQFEALCQALQGYTRRCYLSFATLYGKTARNLQRLKCQSDFHFTEPDDETRRRLASDLRDMAAAHGITAYACCDEAMARAGLAQAHCVDGEIIRALRPDIQLSLKKAPSRPGCGCLEAIDIGAYDTCTFGCVYCYATNSRAAGLARLRAHDPEDTILGRPPHLRGVDLTTLERPHAVPQRAQAVLPLDP